MILFNKRLSAMALLGAPVAIFADEAPVAPTMPDYSFVQTLLMLGLGMAFFYFILYRPEKNKRKALEDSKEKMKQGDRITAVGIVGTIVKIQKETVIIKTAEETKIEVLKAAISEVQAS